MRFCSSHGSLNLSHIYDFSLICNDVKNPTSALAWCIDYAFYARWWKVVFFCFAVQFLLFFFSLRDIYGHGLAANRFPAITEFTECLRHQDNASVR